MSSSLGRVRPNLPPWSTAQASFAAHSGVDVQRVVKDELGESFTVYPNRPASVDMDPARIRALLGLDEPGR